MSMDNVKQCAICRKPFISLGGKICENCLLDIEADFSTIKDYLYDHPQRIGARELAEKTGVSQKIILHLIKEGRIEMEGANVDGGLVCEVCRKPISSGTMCEDCKLELMKSFGPKTEPAPDKPTPISQKKGAKMHVERKD